MAIYHNEELDFRPAYNGVTLDFFGDAALWINTPAQRALPYMMFVGGYPNEWCVPLAHLPKEELEQLISDNQHDTDLISACEEVLKAPGHRREPVIGNDPVSEL